MKKTIITVILSAAIALPIGAAIAKGEMKGHPNLIAAQTSITKAMESLKAAQKANEYDLGGHAKKAEDALATAVTEIHLAAAVANDKK